MKNYQKEEDILEVSEYFMQHDSLMKILNKPIDKFNSIIEEFWKNQISIETDLNFPEIALIFKSLINCFEVTDVNEEYIKSFSILIFKRVINLANCYKNIAFHLIESPNLSDSARKEELIIIEKMLRVVNKDFQKYTPRYESKNNNDRAQAKVKRTKNLKRENEFIYRPNCNESKENVTHIEKKQETNKSMNNPNIFNPEKLNKKPSKYPKNYRSKKFNHVKACILRDLDKVIESIEQNQQKTEHTTPVIPIEMVPIKLAKTEEKTHVKQEINPSKIIQAEPKTLDLNEVNTLDQTQMQQVDQIKTETSPKSKKDSKFVYIPTSDKENKKDGANLEQEKLEPPKPIKKKPKKENKRGKEHLKDRKKNKKEYKSKKEKKPTVDINVQKPNNEDHLQIESILKEHTPSLPIIPEPPIILSPQPQHIEILINQNAPDESPISENLPNQNGQNESQQSDILLNQVDRIESQHIDNILNQNEILHNTNEIVQDHHNMAQQVQINGPDSSIDHIEIIRYCSANIGNHEYIPKICNDLKLVLLSGDDDYVKAAKKYLVEIFVKYNMGITKEIALEYCDEYKKDNKLRSLRRKIS